jgi:serine/threonine-protein kinase
MNLYPPLAAKAPESVQSEGVDKQPAAAEDRSTSVRPVITAGLLVATAIVVGFGFWSLTTRLIPHLINSPVPAGDDSLIFLPDKSVAILPFKESSNQDKTTFPLSGVQGEILTALSKIADLKVISRTSVNGYTADKPRNLREIAENLGVAYALEGSVDQAGEKLHVSVQLTDARTGVMVWNGSYERDTEAVFGVVSDIARQILSRLQVTVSAKEKEAIEERPTNDLIAYGLYLQAKPLIAAASISAQISEKLHEAVRLLDQAVARDPDFYLAYCDLSAAYSYLYFFGFDHTPTGLAAAETALKAVSRLRPDAPETHLVRADFLYRCHLDYEHARAELALAEHALPNNSEIFQLTGYMDRRQGRWEESARSLQRALGLDPHNFLILQQIAVSYQELRKFGPMAAALDRALTLAPHDLDTRVTRALVDLEWKGDSQPLHDLVTKTFQENPATAPDLTDQWFYVALCERDPAAAAQAVSVMAPSGTSVDLNFPRAWCAGWAAYLKGDKAAAQTAFLAARAELQKSVNEEPNYGPNFTVLGLIDAALGRKEDALREGRHALEVLPVTRDALDGAELVKYLGVIYTLCGEKDLAIGQIAATLRIPSTLSYGNLKLHPYWDPLRGDPRFEKIVADLEPRPVEK